ncbi:hypothetical protein GYH30_000799 [Glycine max]|uniref:Polygalacturonase n=2 Tax=Glycine subgen. Soja TaxID=1462606 RepID=A0A0R0LH50_SOYBN|nr:hypothetical protein GYH30_000799 [Glycine max]RZC28929.1 putative polygalacturonase [Glycine soja]
MAAKWRRRKALHFRECDNLFLSGLIHLNSPKNHISIIRCNNSLISNLHMIAPNESPNTDENVISHSSNISIKNSKMEIDCIAINHGSTFISIIGVFCKPGHGIRENGAHQTVEEICVRNCTFNRTTNGARIKTWIIRSDSSQGYARKITFKDIKLVEATNLVIIDQLYNPCDNVCAVRVNDVSYHNVRGISSSTHAIKLYFDKIIGYTNIVLKGVKVTTYTKKKTYASCKHVKGVCSLCNPHVSCLSHK